MKTVVPSVLLLLMLLSGCAAQGGRPDINDAPGVDHQRAAEANADLGLRYMLQGKNELALEKLKKAVAYDPNSINANHFIAELYRRVGKTEEAGEHFERAIRAENSSEPQPALHQNYGVFLCTQKRYDEAEKQFLTVLDNPVYNARAQVYENLGLCFLEKPDITKAETYLRLALTAMPKSPKSLLAMAQVALLQENYQSARGFFERYIEVAPHSAESAWLGVRLERALGDHNAEASYGLLLKNRFPDSPQAREYLQSISP